MVAMFFALFWPACSLAIFVFGFFVGRCGRKVPILDDHLPRALYRGQTHPERSPATGEQATVDASRSADS